MRQVPKALDRLAGVAQEGADESEIPHNAFRLVWSAKDGEYVGLCAEFPSLSWLALTQPQSLALAGIVELREEAVAGLRTEGRRSRRRSATATTQGGSCCAFP